MRTSQLDERRDRLAELLVAAQAGERAALDRIVTELTPVLWQVARAQRLDRETCADVVQTTWLSLLTCLAGIENPTALIGWLVTVTKREAWRVRDVQGRAQPTSDEVFATLPDPGWLPEEQVLDRERAGLLWQAVTRLPQRCQDLLRVVAYVHRPDYEAVAAALGMPRGAIGPNRGRCLAKLRQVLAEHPHWSR
jgi:RNA polymerase sigma factor (sigma-70 family)